MNEENKVRGLSEQQVKENRERWGENILTPPERTSMWKLYLEKYNDPIIKILLVAAAISDRPRSFRPQRRSPLWKS